MSSELSRKLASLSIDRSAPVEDSRGFPWGVLAGGIALGGVVFGGLAWWLAGSAGPETATPAPAAVASASGAASPAPAAAASDLVASGFVVARRRATVAAEITGRVVEVLVEEGMTVREGQLLARLDDALVERDLEAARAQVRAADALMASTRADLADARRILERTQALVKDGFATQADLTRNTARVDSLEAQLVRAQAQKSAASADAERTATLLSKYRITAPFSGVVIDKNAQPGEMISPVSAGGGFTRTGICTIVDMDSLEIEVDVNEAFIGRVRAGQPVDAVLDAYPDLTIPARVIATVPTANRDKATVKVRIALLQKDSRILPDMAVKVTLREQAEAGTGTAAAGPAPGAG
jgi:RND family efflux transporter MFP subunit